LGVNKTYDEALKIIAEDKAKRLADIKTLEAKMADLLKGARTISIKEKEQD